MASRRRKSAPAVRNMKHDSLPSARVSTGMDFSDETPNSHKKYTCNICARTFDKPQYLGMHMRKHSALMQNMPRPYACAHCGGTFEAESALAAHKCLMRPGDRKYRCSLCGDSFKTKIALETHRRRHTGERPFACRECDKRFTQRGALTTHMRVHTGERPYLCDLCGMSFKYRNSYNHHIKMRTCEMDDEISETSGAPTQVFVQPLIIPSETSAQLSLRANRSLSPLNFDESDLQFLEENDKLTSDFDAKGKSDGYESGGSGQLLDDASSSIHQNDTFSAVSPPAGDQLRTSGTSFQSGHESPWHAAKIDSNMERGQTFPCDLCGSAFVDKRQLLGHLRNAHHGVHDVHTER